MRLNKLQSRLFYYYNNNDTNRDKNLDAKIKVTVALQSQNVKKKTVYMIH